MRVHNRSNLDLREVEELVEKFYPYAKESLGFDKDINVVLESDLENAKNPLGNTAYYTPNNPQITVFVDNRHPKDILRSISHELVHHAQCCRGEFAEQLQTEDGYAQSDPHLREMEREAYETGNMVFRDWTDTLNENLRGRLSTMSLNEKQLRKVVKAAISGFDLQSLKEAYFDDDEEEESKHAGKGKDYKTNSGGGYSSGITNVTEVEEENMSTEKQEQVQELLSPVVAAKDAIKMNEIKPFVMIGGKTYLWEESDGINLRVSDQGGTDHNFKLADVEDLQAPEAITPLNEWYEDSLYKKLLTEYTK
tara:strand:- start:26101 stop:27024 length:924 start_codon:yes stop_codon:yes gene_type:complete